MSKAVRRLLGGLKRREEGLLYRVAGLPIALGALMVHSQPATAAERIRLAYARYYWMPDNLGDSLDLISGLLLWPIALLLSAVHATWRNGAAIRRRSGRHQLSQIFDQLQLFATAGILPHWYYIFSLHEPGGKGRAAGFINRCETKHGVYRILRAARTARSPLNNKLAFAEHCRRHQLPAVPVFAAACDGEFRPGSELPARDLFVKPISAQGGKGAERWDHLGDGRYRRLDGCELDRDGLHRRLAWRSHRLPILVQPRMTNHDCIADLSNGALSTVRALTCLDEDDRPELVAAVFRMAVGANRTVDNIHAGGIAAAVDLATGCLTAASNIGMDDRLGWLDRHPQTGGAITGRTLPLWAEVRQLAVVAHNAFLDRIVIGWDIALTTEGLRIVEGNAGPDVDLMQRPLKRGLGDGRFGELLAHHLDACSQGQAALVRA